jgi:hypothetical protein
MTGIRWLMTLFFAMFLLAGLAMVFQKNWAKMHPTSIQTAARADLDLLRKAEDAFRERNGIYTTDIVSLSLEPKFVYYKFGFVTPATPNTEALNFPEPLQPERSDLDALKSAKPKLELEYAEETKLTSIKISELTNFCSDCTATKDTFKAIAAANLDDDPDLDIWTIDQTGTVTHIQDDLKETK